MPKAALPTTPRGWVAALIASFVGFVSGFLALSWLEKKWR